MSKIKILAIPPDTHGVGKFRILDPFKYIGTHHADEFHVDIVTNPTDNDAVFKDYDIVVFHSFIHPKYEDTLERIKKLRAQGTKVVMDIDDYWTPDHRHPGQKRILELEIPKKKIGLMRASDYICTTTKKFAETIKKRVGNKDILVFPNAVDPNEKQFQPNPTESEFIRFGWLGGSSHYHDLDLLRGGVSIIQDSFKNTKFVLCGFDTRGNATIVNPETGEKTQRPIKPKETVWYQYEKIFTDNYKHLDKNYQDFLMAFRDGGYDDTKERYSRVWTQPVGKYAANYNHFDVSLAPLVESEFNSNKSQLKAIEAGFHKKALIASEVLPYTLDLVNSVEKGKFVDGNALLVSPKRNHKQWHQHMKRLINNPNMIEDMGNRLYETVKDDYSLVNVSKNRTEFFKSII